MDVFWCSMCVNDCINVPDVIGSFSGCTTTPMLWKVELNNLGWNSRDFALSWGKIWLYPFYNFLIRRILRTYTKISSNLKQNWCDSDFCDFLLLWFFYQSLDILTQHVISFWNPYLPWLPVWTVTMKHKNNVHTMSIPPEISSHPSNSSNPYAQYLYQPSCSSVPVFQSQTHTGCYKSFV